MILKNILMGDLGEYFSKYFVAANWLLLAVMVIVAVVVSTPKMASGILAGGVVANLNCIGLERDCRRMIRWRTMAAYYGGLAVRLGLIALAVTAILLVFPAIFSPVGLFIGLSAPVVIFYLLVLAMVIHRVRFKEAT